MTCSYLIFEKKMKEKGVNASQVAKATGVNPAAIYEWKHGAYHPKAEKILKIARFFGCQMEEFYVDD